MRQVRTLWEMLPLLGIPTGAIGWPATRVDAPGVEFAFADRFFGPTLDRSAARPEELSERAWMFRLGVEELDPRHLGRLEGAVPEAVLHAMAGDVWRQSLARYLFAEGSGRALFVRLPGLSEASGRFFGGYAQRRFAGRQGPELDRAVEVLGGYYEELDGFLSALWEQVSGPRLLAVVSSSGVEEPTEVERFIGRLRGASPLRGDMNRGADGILCLLGEGIRSDTLVTGASLVDVVPTLLYGMGLPVARDLDGRVLAEVFERSFLESHPLTFVPSYETLGGPVLPRPTGPTAGRRGRGGSKPRGALTPGGGACRSWSGRRALGCCPREGDRLGRRLVTRSRFITHRPSKMAPSSIASEGSPGPRTALPWLHSWTFFKRGASRGPCRRCRSGRRGCRRRPRRLHRRPAAFETMVPSTWPSTRNEVSNRSSPWKWLPASTNPLSSPPGGRS